MRFFSVSDYIAWSERVKLNNELERMSKEVVVD